jgi:hypothetical protein
MNIQIIGGSKWGALQVAACRVWSMRWWECKVG